MAIPVVDDVSVMLPSPAETASLYRAGRSSDMLDFMLRCRVQFEMTLPHRVEIPGKRSDGIGYLEQRVRQRLALRRVGGERDRRPAWPRPPAAPQRAMHRSCRSKGRFRSSPAAGAILREAWGPGWVLVGDAGYFKDPSRKRAGGTAINTHALRRSSG